MYHQPAAIGMMVHFYESGEAEPQPALITRVVSPERLNLCVFGDGELKWPTSVVYGEPEPHPVIKYGPKGPRPAHAHWSWA